MGARKLPKPLAGAKSVSCLPYCKIVCGRLVGGRGEKGSQSTTGGKKLWAGWSAESGSCMATKEGIVLTIFYIWGRRKRGQNELGFSFLDSCLARFAE